MKTVNKTLEEAAEINTNSDFGETEYLQLSTLTREEINEDGIPELYVSSDGYIDGCYLNYPSNDGEARLTNITIWGGDYHIFGIKLNDEIDAATEILKQREFEEIDPEVSHANTNSKAFKKGDVFIQFETLTDSYTISKMFISTGNLTSRPWGYVE